MIYALAKRQKHRLHIELIVDTPYITLTGDLWGVYYMMTSSNGNIFRVTGPLCGEFTGHRWIPRSKAIDTEL